MMDISVLTLLHAQTQLYNWIGPETISWHCFVTAYNSFKIPVIINQHNCLKFCHKAEQEKKN